jgi:regulation of enolase protein 1 (concanavalin A-like superfamily)
VKDVSHPSLPGKLSWMNLPLEWRLEEGGQLSITAAGKTDLFFDPAGSSRIDSSPCALFTPPDPAFILSARVSVGFAATFDAGVLLLRGSKEAWAKLCFEYSPQREAMAVSVVTRGISDDCNSAVIEGDAVYLRIAHTPAATSFHYSLDGSFWRLVRHFTLGTLTAPQAGFSSQSPTGSGCRAVFSEIRYRAGTLKDIRSGE